MHTFLKLKLCPSISVHALILEGGVFLTSILLQLDNSVSENYIPLAQQEVTPDSFLWAPAEQGWKAHQLEGTNALGCYVPEEGTVAFCTGIIRQEVLQSKRNK